MTAFGINDEIEELELSTRTFNVLFRANIRKISEVDKLLCSDKVYMVRQLGKVTLKELDEKVGKLTGKNYQKIRDSIGKNFQQTRNTGRWLRPRPVPQVWSLFMADCSECGKITYMGDYCMECGAKMERDDE